MSYVLEALKKAQAQREQGGIPSIYSLQVPYVAVEGKPGSNLKPVLWVITGLLMIILGLFAWRMGGNLWMLQNGAAAVAQVPSTPQITPARAAAPAQISRPVLETLSEGEVQVTGPTASEPVTPKRKEKATPPTSKAPTAIPTPVPKPKPEPKVQSDDAVHKIYAVTELPEGVRRELPTLVISGGSYSSNPTQRLIIVNNQVFTENSQPAPGVVVERIEQNAAVLSFKGYSYRMGY